MSAPNSGLARLRRTFRRPAPFDPDAIAAMNLAHAEEQRELYREQGRREAKNASWYAGYDIGYTDGYQEGRRNAYSALGHDLPQEPVKELSEGWTPAGSSAESLDPSNFHR